MTTISFYGDSFCASTGIDSWCTILADKLEAKIIKFGRQGSSIWQTFLDFEKDRNESNLPNYLIFCWTEPSRLYHPELPLTAGNKPIPNTDIQIWNAAETYYKYLSYQEKDDIAYQYALNWFDKHILSQYESNSKIIQTWSLRKFNFELSTGFFLNETCFEFAADGDINNYKFNLNDPNHMSVEKNKEYADKLFKIYNNWKEYQSL
jgi:hypothetical protein